MNHEARADAVPALINLSRSHEPAVCGAAVEMLGWIRAGAAGRIPQLPPLMEEVALQQIGDNRESAQRLVRDDAVAMEILNNLKSGDRNRSYLVPFLIEAMVNGSAEVKAEALSIAASLCPELLGQLDDAVHQSDPWVQENSIHALSLLAPSNAGAAKLVVDALKSPDERIQLLATREIGGLGKGAAAAVPELVLLASRNNEVSITAVVALGNLGSIVADSKSNASAIDVLSRRALDKADPAAALATFAWTQIAPAADERQTQLLTQWMHSTETAIRERAMTLFFDVLPQGPSTVGAVASLLDDSNNDIRLRAVDVLAALGPVAHPAALKLSRMVDNQFAPLRQAAARALVRVDPTPQQLAAAYVAAARNGDIDAQATLTQAVRKSSESSERAKSRLTELAKADPDENVRTHAKAAIDAIAK